MAPDSRKMLKKTPSLDMPLDFAKWTVKETCQYLEKEGLGQWADKFKEHHITGDRLRGLTVANLKEMGIEQHKDHEKILLCIRKLWQIPGKVINDPIHGHVELHPLLIKIIDTHQFQRLRYMKQLGGAYFVYPGASHNRFEHSIGVAHLAGELIKSLRARQPELGITDRDMLCVQIAGLCHDLGHGPFSHMFDSMFIPKVRPNTTWKHEDASCAMFDHLVKNNELKQMMKEYGLELPCDQVFIKEMIVGPLYSTAQEQLQAVFQVLKEKVKRDHGVELEYDPTFIREIIVGLLDSITTREQLQAVFQVVKKKVKRDHDVELQDDPTFIKEIITPFWLVKEKMVKAYGMELPGDQAFIEEVIRGLLDSGTAQEQWPYKGREKNRSFLYEIVANKTTGIDVDKFDYFARDCYHLGLQNNFDYRRFLKFARVCEVEDNGKKQICIRDKEVYNLYNMFHTRYCIHRGACQHRVSSIIQTMMADAFVKADKHIKFEGSDGKMFTLSEAIDDMEAYTKLTDCVFEQILNFPSKDLTEDQKRDMGEAKQILRRIITRDLYRCLGEIGIKPSTDEEGICDDLKKELTRLDFEGLKPGDLEAAFISMDYGMKHKDPIEKVRFYSKDKPNKGVKKEREQVSNVLPTYFSDELIRFYCKKTDEEELKTAKENFEKWREDCKNTIRSHRCNNSERTCVLDIYPINPAPVPDEPATPEPNIEENIPTRSEVLEDDQN